MASLSDDEILDAVAYQMQTDRDYRRQLEVAVQSKNDSWISRLVRFVVGALIEVGRVVLAAITGWFIPPRLPGEMRTPSVYHSARRGNDTF